MQYDALALFSGGLDSILASKLIQKQGLKVLGIHFYSPFFNKSEHLERWSKIYGLDLIGIDISRDYIDMLLRVPENGYGSAMNPCVDCKILMLKKTKELLEKYSAKFIISGEVVGQRPMSQRRDALNRIKNSAGVEDYLLRPLCAQCLEPTKFELEGLVDRQKLLAISGRGRSEQLRLADEFALSEVPTPAGGCKLTEKENAKRYWPLLSLANVQVEDFELANCGRQLWHNDNWFILGRNNEDNEAIQRLAKSDDYILKVQNYPGPLGLARNCAAWSKTSLLAAATLLASYSSKALAFISSSTSSEEKVTVQIMSNKQIELVEVLPNRESIFIEYAFENVQEAIRDLRKNGQLQQI